MGNEVLFSVAPGVHLASLSLRAEPHPGVSMTAYTVAPATMAHVEQIAPRMREADKAEIWAASHAEPYHALKTGLEQSPLCWSGLVDGAPVCMFGVAPLTLLGGTGIVWMLGTDDVQEHARAFLRRNKSFIAQMMGRFYRLENWVDARNTLSIRWLRWLGFVIEEAKPYGLERWPFHHFFMEK